MTRLLIPALLLIVATAPAAAQSSTQADALFKDGKRLMGLKRYGEACSAFEASYKLDPSISTLVNHADCREKNEQYATAWGLFLEADRQTRGIKKHAALNKLATERAAALEPRLSYLIINVPDDSRVDGLAITQNGATVDPVTWNRALPVDGGSYVVEGKAPGHEPWQTTVTVKAELDKQSVDVPRFKSVPAPDVVDPPKDEPRVDGAPAEPETAIVADGGGMTGKRKAALGLGGVGVVTVITAVVFELGAQRKYDEAVDEGDDELQAELYDSAKSKRTLAVVTGSIGVACVSVAAYLWVTGASPAPRGEHALRLAPEIGADGVGVSFSGSF